MTHIINRKLIEKYGNAKTRKQEPKTIPHETGKSRKVKESSRKSLSCSTPAKRNRKRLTNTPGKLPAGKVYKWKLAPGKRRLNKEKWVNSDNILSLLPFRLGSTPQKFKPLLIQVKLMNFVRANQERENCRTSVETNWNQDTIELGQLG